MMTKLLIALVDVPLLCVAEDTIIVGVTGADFGIRGFIASFKAETGALLWRHYTVPKKNEKGSETWQGPEPVMGGDSTWLTVSPFFAALKARLSLEPAIADT